MVKLILGFLLLTLFACSDSGSSLDASTEPVANVTLLSSVNGVGDNSYNDQILAGVFRFNRNSGVPVRLLQPDSLEEARQMVQEWIETYSAADSSLLILASSEYQTMAQKLDAHLTGKGSRVLLLEGDSSGLPENVYSFWIDRYGASYLAGAIAGEYPSVILAAAPGFSSLENSIEGFRKGYEAHKVVEDTLVLYYISEEEGDESAFNNVEWAYLAMSALILNDLFSDSSAKVFFPLLGGAFKGALRAKDDCLDDNNFLIGMDVNYGDAVPKVPYSMTVEIKNVLLNYLEDWQSGKNWPRYTSLGLSDGATSIVINKNYDNVEVFEKRYNQYYDEAVREEARHAKK